MDLILLILRLFLAGIFGLAGVAKLFDQRGAAKAAADFGVPAGLAKAAAFVLSAAEIVISVLLLTTATSWVGAVAALALLLIFIAGMVMQLIQGKNADCHCFGQLHSEPVSVKSLIRNALFSIPAIILVVQGSGRQGLNLTDGNSENMQLLFGIAVCGLLAAAVFYLRQISGKQTQILRRIEILDIAAREGSSVKREEAGLPEDSLPIGAKFPDFELPDVSGRIVRYEHLFAERKPILFLFVASNCSPCAALLPEFKSWAGELSGKVKLVLVSRGTAAENRQKFDLGDDVPVLLQKNRELATAVHARWTPSALFVNADGIVSSHVATGDSAIRELVDDIRSGDLSGEYVFFTRSNGGGREPKIGEPVPEFALTDISGRPVDSTDLKGRQTLVAFWSMTCPHCRKMMDEIREWEKAKEPADPEIVVFSDGDPEEHKEFGLSSPILIDRGYAVAEKFGMFGTPSAVLVNEDGKIVSETAIGAPNIWALIGIHKN
jgi:peroxiredoxin/uncharacterized membrane protein YphA (DoxX/SURF4 family)